MGFYVKTASVRGTYDIRFPSSAFLCWNLVYVNILQLKQVAQERL
jgi:hypothetical protein